MPFGTTKGEFYMSTIFRSHPVIGQEKEQVSLPPAGAVAASKPNLRTIIGGICFIGTALVFLPGIFFPSPNLNDAAEALAAVGADPTTFLIMTLFDLLYAILLVPALLGIASLPRARGAALTYAGAGLALFGNLGHTVYVTFALIVRQIAVPEANRAEMIALLNRINEDTAIIFVLPMLLAYAVGLLVMVAGLRRAGIIPLWPVVLMVIAVALDLGPGGHWGYTVKVILASIVFVRIGLAMIRRREESQWV
jgi:hypothetical protein